MKKIFLTLTIMLLIAGPAAADITGAGDAATTFQLTKIYAMLQTKYATMLKKLQEAKAQSELLQDMVEKSRMVKKEYDFVRNFRIEKVIKRVEGDFFGLTHLDDLNGKSSETQFGLVLDEIDRRFDSPSKSDQKLRRTLKGRVNELERLQELLQAKMEEAEHLTSSDANIRSIQGANATTNCLLLGLEIQRQQRAMMEDMNKSVDHAEMENKLGDFSKALRSMGKGTASAD